jgi:short-chain fatty acids transporter
MILTVMAILLAILGAGATLDETVLAWGGGMWALLELAMQFTIAMIAAHACVSSRPAHRFLDWLASLPSTPVGAVVMLGAYSMVIGYFNWAASVVASALFVPFVARRNPKADVRLMIAAAYMGMGTVWHGGLSGSAPLILATPGNPIMEPGTGAPIIDRLLPVTETLFVPFNMMYLVVVFLVALALLWVLHPRKDPWTLTQEQLDVMMPTMPAEDEPKTPAAGMEHFRGWVLLAVVLIGYPLGHSIITRGFGASWNINSYNAVFLVGALLLQGRPSNVVRAFGNGARTASGVILQFPFYAGIFGVINSTGLGTWLGELFVAVATTETYPAIVYLYSGFVNLFVPSGGSKWLIEAPYLLPAARELNVSATTTVLAYAYGDSTSNLLQPFWAIPILTVTRMKFGDVLGYTGIMAAVLGAVTIVAMLLIPSNL